ncbi:MAG: SgcJ/EcaC family oxidoreductase [Bacteroidota bacterium]
MGAKSIQGTPTTGSAAEAEVRWLYQELLNRWNERTADGMAELFMEDGNLIGFDGSQMNGRQEAAAALGQIFADHLTAAYIGIVREVRFLTPEVAVLRAVAGMVPAGQSDINPAVNAVQTLVVVRQEGRWRIAVFQNTPAALHGRPELSEQLTRELQEAMHLSTLDRGEGRD